MKKYIKPVMDIENANLVDCYMVTPTVDGEIIPGGGPSGGGGGDAKLRDELEEEEIIQILKEQEEGANTPLW